MKNSCFCHFEDYWIQPDLYGELKGDFKQRKKSTLSKPATNNHGKGVNKRIRCAAWEDQD